MPIVSIWSPSSPQLLSSLAKNEDSGDSLFRFDSLARATHGTQGNTNTSLLKGMIKDTAEQTDEEIHRAKLGRVLSAAASPEESPWSWGASPFWCGCVPQHESSLNPLY